MPEPLIGITCGEDWAARQYCLREYYVRVIEEAGGVPILLSPVTRASGRKKYMEVLDGLLLSGGVDVDPCYFGEEPLPGMGKVTPKRDAFETALIKNFFPLGKPILAICRGMQILNTALGGTIYQDIYSQTANCLKHDQEAPVWHPSHGVRFAEGSRLEKMAGTIQWRVNSFHHQAVRRAAIGFSITARAADGIVEGMEAPDHPFAVGVQWHPECSWRSDSFSFKIFQEFVRAARKR